MARVRARDRATELSTIVLSWAKYEACCKVKTTTEVHHAELQLTRILKK